MKMITVHVSEETYHAFQESAARSGSSASDLIRAVMEEYYNLHLARKGSIFDEEGADVGRIILPLGGEDDILDEMLS